MKRLTIEYIREQFEKEGCTLLTKKYKNNNQKLKYICSYNKIHFVSWNNWRRVRKCVCDLKKDKNNEMFKKIQECFLMEGYVLLSAEYINCHEKLKVLCPKKHEYYVSWRFWKRGSRCPYCNGGIKLDFDFIKTKFGEEGYSVLSDKYINSKRKLKYICPKGHKHSITWANWLLGYRCPYCVGIISKGEIEVRDFIKSLDIEVSQNNRTQISNPDTGNGFELDIFMPDFNKAIEYNGEYWHQDKNRDLLKLQLCKDKNIDLLTIWDGEWKDNSDKCKEKMVSFIFNGGEKEIVI